MAIHTIYNEYQSPPSPNTQSYGCTKPKTTSTIVDLRINGGVHDVTYSNVRFEANDNTSTVLMRITSGTDADIYNVTFDHCVFATMTPLRQGDNFHMLNYSLTGKVIHHITFTNCWFEPSSRMALELNGRGGWWHDVTIDHCTFEGGLGEVISADMSPGNYTPTAPWGVSVSGTVRGVEGLVVTNNLIEGTGAPSVNGYTQPDPSKFYGWRKAVELGCVYPYAEDDAIGRSIFAHNKVGRCLDASYQTNYSGASYVSFTDNVFDHSYNPHDCPEASGRYFPIVGGVSASHFTFARNEYRLGAPHSSIYVAGYSGTTNSYSGDRWYSSRASIDANLDVITNSTYADCDFWLPSTVKLGSGCTYDSACYFHSGRSGGTPA